MFRQATLIKCSGAHGMCTYAHTDKRHEITRATCKEEGVWDEERGMRENTEADEYEGSALYMYEIMKE